MKNKKVPVKNRSNRSISYKIDSLRIRRNWAKPGDVLVIPVEELLELTMIPGGVKLLDKYLLIEDDEAIAMVLGEDIQPEYKYNDKEIKFLLYEGSDDQFLDALEYAPEGVLDLIKNYAIKKTPNTSLKVDAINKKFSINLDSIQRNFQESLIGEEEKPAENSLKRRSAPVKVEEKKPSKYKILEQ